MDERDRSRNEYLDCQIEITHKVYFEAGNNLGKAFLTYLLLMCFAALLIWGKGFGNEVKIPFLELTINKIYAALIVLVFSCFTLYWFFSTLKLTRLLGRKLTALLYERYGASNETRWNLAYPSAYSTFLMVNRFNRSRVGVLTVTGFQQLFPVVNLLLPLLMAWFIGDAFNLSLIYKILLCLSILLLIIPSMHTLRSLRPDHDKSLIRALDEYREGQNIGAEGVPIKLPNGKTEQR